MQEIIKKTFGGLSTQYYLRQLFFSTFFSGLIIYSIVNNPKPIEFGMIAVLIFNTLLYPYSRFVYEGIIGFIMGSNRFFGNALIVLITKFITMALCYSFAIIIAPIGLAYLYYRHNKATV